MTRCVPRVDHGVFLDLSPAFRATEWRHERNEPACRPCRGVRPPATRQRGPVAGRGRVRCRLFRRVAVHQHPRRGMHTAGRARGAGDGDRRFLQSLRERGGVVPRGPRPPGARRLLRTLRRGHPGVPGGRNRIGHLLRGPDGDRRSRVDEAPVPEPAPRHRPRHEALHDREPRGNLRRPVDLRSRNDGPRRRNVARRHVPVRPRREGGRRRQPPGEHPTQPRRRGGGRVLESLCGSGDRRLRCVGRAVLVPARRLRIHPGRPLDGGAAPRLHGAHPRAARIRSPRPCVSGLAGRDRARSLVGGTEPAQVRLLRDVGGGRKRTPVACGAGIGAEPRRKRRAPAHRLLHARHGPGGARSRRCPAVAAVRGRTRPSRRMARGARGDARDLRGRRVRPVDLPCRICRGGERDGHRGLARGRRDRGRGGEPESGRRSPDRRLTVDHEHVRGERDPAGRR